MVLSNGNMHLMKILPYIRQDKQTDGVVITFVDTTTIKELDMYAERCSTPARNIIRFFQTGKE